MQGDTGTDAAANKILFALAMTLDTPSPADHLFLRGNFWCYLAVHDPATACAKKGRRTGAEYLATKLYLTRHKQEGRDDSFSLTAKL